jgi:serine/threonine protein phosphatase 1
MRLLAISDPHGCLEVLKRLLNKVKYNPKEDKLIILGDYVDRGPNPMETLLFIEKLMDEGAIALIGNHDSMFQDLINSHSLQWALNQQYYHELGSISTIESYLKLDKEEQEHIQYILNRLLPYHIEGDFIFVHAGVDAKLPIEENDFQELIWIRNEFYTNKAYDDKIVVFGHTPTCNLNPDRNCAIWIDTVHKDKIGIDSACVYGGAMACLDLTNMIEYYER